jgi:SAM-dependent methyltransferase
MISGMSTSSLPPTILFNRFSLLRREPVTRYDLIGHGYSKTRREDPRFRARIHAALGSARTVVNVGAGTGAYEPLDRHVLAIEPSDVMAAQRSPDLAPALRVSAGNLPLRDRSVDAAMAILSVHHWDEEREQGVRELRRVARGPVVILTFDATVFGTMWLMADYLPEVAALDLQIFPPPQQLADWLGGEVRIDALPIPCDTPDWMLGSFWAHPERVLDASARAATSGFARMPTQVVDRVVAEVSRDLASGRWDDRHGYLRSLDALDVGLRLIVATPRWIRPPLEI